MKLIPWSPFSQIEAYTVTRIGGVSKGDCESLNLSFNVGDDPIHVIKNRQRLAEYLNTDLDHMVASRQTHSTNLLKVTKEDGGRGMYSIDDAFYNYDALYTRDKNLYLLSFHADCTPVLIYAKDQELIASIHSGWKGNVDEITLKTISYLIQHEQCNPQEIYAYIGPSINNERFEVGQDVIDQINQMSFNAKDFYKAKENGKYLFNAKGLVEKQLLLCGIPQKNITISKYCTIQDHDLFFSYRRNKKCGRNVSMIKMK